MTVGCDWIDFPGELFSDAKARFLASGTYAIHAMRTEAFGISVTEYLKSGLIPIVPDEGGAHEVVSDAELSFGSKEDAAKILARLVTDDEFRESKRSSCLKRAEEFSMEAYERRERELLDAIVAG
jgi:glycosyltransferase involved in cell wall biosynthesis